MSRKAVPGGLRPRSTKGGQPRAPEPVDVGPLTASQVRSYPVGVNMFVELRYEVRDAESAPLLDHPERMGVVIGAGQLLPSVERALDGLLAGEERTVELPSEQAFGPRDPAAVVAFERTEFPDDVKSGDNYEVEDADGRTLVLRVLEVDADAVVVDMNHPLAGQDLEVQVSVLSVRPATEQEIELACAIANDPGDQSEPCLLAPEHLLGGRCRR